MTPGALPIGGEVLAEFPGGLNRYLHKLRTKPSPWLASTARGADRQLGERRPRRARWLLALCSPGLIGVRREVTRSSPKYDVVDAHFPYYAASPLLTGAITGKPFLVHFHGPWADRASRSGKDGSRCRRSGVWNDRCTGAQRPDGGALPRLQAPAGRALPDFSLEGRRHPPLRGPRAVSSRRRSQGTSAARPPCERAARGHGSAARTADGPGRASARVEPAGLGNLVGRGRGPGAPAPRRSGSRAGDRGSSPVHGVRGRGSASRVLRRRRRLCPPVARSRGIRPGRCSRRSPAARRCWRPMPAVCPRRWRASGVTCSRPRETRNPSPGGWPRRLGGTVVAAVGYPLPGSRGALLPSEAGRGPPGPSTQSSSTPPPGGGAGWSSSTTAPACPAPSWRL